MTSAPRNGKAVLWQVLLPRKSLAPTLRKIFPTTAVWQNRPTAVVAFFGGN
jgi:hypothetical protein